MKNPAFVTALFLLAACSSTPPESARVPADDVELNVVGVTLTVDRDTYAPGDAVTMRIGNGSADTLGYNPCGSRSVERAADGRWVVHPEPNRMCTLELHVIPPGETATGTTRLPGDVRPGTHRIVLALQVMSSGETVRAASPPFRVGEK